MKVISELKESLKNIEPQECYNGEENCRECPLYDEDTSNKYLCNSLSQIIVNLRRVKHV